MDKISDDKALDIMRRIKACNKYFDPIRENENDFPEDDIINYPDGMLPFYVSYDERKKYSLYEWLTYPPKRYLGLCNDEPYVIDDYYNVLGEMSITGEKKIKGGFICKIRLTSYNCFDYHGKYDTTTGDVHLIANRKFW